MRFRLEGDDWVNNPPPPVDWLVEGLFAHPNKAIFAGETGAYKSWFMPAMALHLAAGKDFLGHKVPKARKVLYLNEDMPTDDMRARFHYLAKGHGIDPKGNLRIINNAGLTFGLNSNGDPVKALQMLNELKLQGFVPDVIIMEVLLTVSGGDMSNERIAAFYRSLLPLTELPCSIIITHHFTKYSTDQQGNPVRTDLRVLGGMYVRGGVDAMATLTVQNHEEAIIEAEWFKLRRAKRFPKFRWQLKCAGDDQPATVERYHTPVRAPQPVQTCGPGDPFAYPVSLGPHAQPASPGPGDTPSQAPATPTPGSESR